MGLILIVMLSLFQIMIGSSLGHSTVKNQSSEYKFDVQQPCQII